MKRFGYIFAAFLSVLLLFSCGFREAKVISRKDMARIYAEMLLTDQWIVTNPSMRRVADTSLVYEPILNRYGYTKEDYILSVNKYMDDPERYSRILRTTGEILDEKLSALNDRKEKLEKEAALRRALEEIRIEAEIDIAEYFPYLFDEPYVHYYDSVAVELDSMMVYRLRNVERTDTVFDGIKVIVKDTLAAGDSLALPDTVKSE